MVGIVDEALPGGSEESLKIGDHIKALTTFIREKGYNDGRFVG